MRLTNQMSPQKSHYYPVIPLFVVTERTVELDSIHLSYQDDAFAACIALNFHHRGPEDFQEMYWAMEKALVKCPTSLLSECFLYGQLRQILRPESSVLHTWAESPVEDFVAEMAGRTRYQSDTPMTFRDFQDDLSGNRQSPL